ncbi:hypothetical protein NL676_009278 [Syzygium grande]|nr:hypothetical protein NL676_009278 [Syzygium grande]
MRGPRNSNTRPPPRAVRPPRSTRRLDGAPPPTPAAATGRESQGEGEAEATSRRSLFSAYGADCARPTK